MVAELMKDPASVQFRSVKLHRVGEIRFVCGEVNAKNSYGGYVGYAFLQTLSSPVSPELVQQQEALDRETRVTASATTPARIP